MAVVCGKIQGVVESENPPFNLTKRDRFFFHLQISPSQKYGAELKYFGKQPFPLGVNSEAKVMLKIVDFEKQKYEYYWINAPDMKIVKTWNVFWLEEKTILFVFANSSHICCEQYQIDHQNFKVEKKWERMVKSKYTSPLLPLTLKIMQNLLTCNDQNFIVICELGSKDLRFCSVEENCCEEKIMTCPSEITIGEETFVTAYDSTMVLNGSLYFEANKTRSFDGKIKKDEKYLIRVNVAEMDLSNENWLLNLDTVQYEIVKFPGNDLWVTSFSSEWIVYKTVDNEDRTVIYSALNVPNYTWKTIDVVGNMGYFVVVDGSSLILCNQYGVTGYPVYATPIEYRIHKNVLDSTDENSQIVNYLTGKKK